MTRVSYQGNTLKIGNNEVRLSYPVKKFEVIENTRETIVVLLNVLEGKGPHSNTNVRAFDVDANELWTIDHPKFENKHSQENSFRKMWREDGDLYVRDFLGSVYEVDVDTGEVEFVKRTN